MPARQDIEFVSKGARCRGWFYAPPKANAPAPAIVMSHGFSAVKEHHLDKYAAAFNAAGFAVTVFDYRFLGASEGAPRQRIIPAEQHDDLRAALGWTAAQAGVDSNRIGVWGSSYSGGHALFVGALDPRIKVIVAQVPAMSVVDSLLALVGKEGFAFYLSMLAEDHAARNRGEPGGVIPVVGPAGQPSVLSSPDSYEWFTKAAAIAPNWRNEVTLESVARMIEYQPANFIHLIAPKPLLVQAARKDSLIPFAQIEAAFARAGEPKRLDVFECGHFDCYETEPFHSRAVESAREWYKKHL